MIVALGIRGISEAIDACGHLSHVENNNDNACDNVRA